MSRHNRERRRKNRDRDGKYGITVTDTHDESCLAEIIEIAKAGAKDPRVDLSTTRGLHAALDIWRQDVNPERLLYALYEARTKEPHPVVWLLSKEGWVVTERGLILEYLDCCKHEAPEFRALLTQDPQPKGSVYFFVAGKGGYAWSQSFLAIGQMPDATCN